MIVNNDSLETLRTFASDLIDALVTDPPAGISFMGKDWDKRDDFVQRMTEIYRECLRVLKPGAHGLVWAIPRTSHWTATALEQAGFEIRDVVTHVFGSGFPKASALNRSKSGEFCQCALNKHNIEDKDRGQLPDAHKNNQAASSDDGPQLSNALHLSHIDADSQGGYPVCHGLYDEPAHSCSSASQVSAPVLECAQEHIHSAAPSDGQDCEPLHNPSQALHNAPLSSLDCLPHAPLSSNTCANKISLDGASTPMHNAQTLTDNNHIQQKQSAFPPLCADCGKPNPNGWYNGGLKPASEHWILIRKPLSEPTVAKNVLKHGTGAINVDGSRIACSDKSWTGSVGRVSETENNFGNGNGLYGDRERTKDNSPNGRFPANFILSHNEDCDEQCAEGCAVAELDRQSGERSSGGYTGKRRGMGYHGGAAGTKNALKIDPSSGGASRFFYCAKASKRDRNEGLEGMPAKEAADFDSRPSGDFAKRMNRDRPPVLKQNTHPTVKSTKLMEYLITLITPPGGVVLDPFMGSGSTGVAANRLGFKFYGIEREKEYFDIAEKRLKL